MRKTPPQNDPTVPTFRVRPNQRGFTVIEVALASFVLVFAILSSFSVMITGFRTLEVARNITLSSQIAQSEIERLRLLNWAEIAALPGSSSVDMATAFTSDAKLASRFTVTREVADVAGRTGEMRDITVIVSWTGLDGILRHRSYHMRYGKNGLYDYYYTLARS